MSVTLFSPTAPAAPAGSSLLLDLKELSRLLARSEASLQRDADVGRIPNPVKIGRSVRWRRSEIENWLAAGCPTREREEGGK